MIENGTGKYILMAATTYLVHTTPLLPLSWIIMEMVQLVRLLIPHMIQTYCTIYQSENIHLPPYYILNSSIFEIKSSPRYLGTWTQSTGYLGACGFQLHELRYRVRRLLVLIFCWGELCCGSLRETLGGSGCRSTHQRP